MSIKIIWIYIYKTTNHSEIAMILTSDCTVLQFSFHPNQVTSSAATCRLCNTETSFSPKFIATDSFSGASYA